MMKDIIYNFQDFEEDFYKTFLGRNRVLVRDKDPRQYFPLLSFKLREKTEA